MLVSKVFRAKFMKKGQEWMNEAPKVASYLWKSLLSARILLINGIMKQVGDGNTIKVQQDRWLLDSRNRKVKSNKAGQAEVHYVKDLIRQGKWDKDLLSKIFDKEEAQKIANIPINIYQRKDRIMWNHSKFEVYTVKSGYVLAREMTTQATKIGQNKEQTSNHNRKESQWKKVWGTNAKHKLKRFIRNACRIVSQLMKWYIKRQGKEAISTQAVGKGLRQRNIRFLSVTMPRRSGNLVHTIWMD